jgi:hypothetical protein
MDMSSGFAVEDGVALAVATGVSVAVGDGEGTAAGAAVQETRSATAMVR